MQVTLCKDADDQACKLVLRACLPANCTQLVTNCRGGNCPLHVVQLARAEMTRSSSAGHA